MDVASVAGPVAATLLGAFLLGGLLTGCGSGEEAISGSAADTLHRQVDAVRAAVTEGRTPAAESAVANLRSTISRLTSAGELNPADGVVLLTQVDRIAASLEKSPAPTPKPTPKPTPAPVVDSGGGGDGDDGGNDGGGKGNSNGKGKGKGK